MYVSVTGLKQIGLISWIRFWTLTIPTSKDTKVTNGILHSAFNSWNGFQRTLNVWKAKEDMLAYFPSSFLLKTMNLFSKIGIGKVYGGKAKSVPSWDHASALWIKNRRLHRVIWYH